MPRFALTMRRARHCAAHRGRDWQISKEETNDELADQCGHRETSDEPPAADDATRRTHIAHGTPGFERGSNREPSREGASEEQTTKTHSHGQSDGQDGQDVGVMMCTRQEEEEEEEEVIGKQQTTFSFFLGRGGAGVGLFFGGVRGGGTIKRYKMFGVSGQSRTPSACSTRNAWFACVYALCMTMTA